MKIPVLMYHALVHDSDTSSHHVHVKISEFQKQMNWLAQEGYTTQSLADWKNLKGSEMNQHKVIITFDDGSLSLYKEAMPILKMHKFTAVLFLTTSPVGESDFRLAPGLAFSQVSGDRPLNWQEVRELELAGWEIEAHSKTHPNHAILSRTALEDEIIGSANIISKQLGKPVLYYAFPYGYYSTQTLEILKENHFTSSFAVHPGLSEFGSNSLKIPRISIERNTSFEVFKRQVKTGYRSNGQKWKSLIRDILFSSSKLKELITNNYRAS